MNVSKEAREAAADAIQYARPILAIEIRAERMDHYSGVQAFAKFEVEITQRVRDEALEEAAKVADDHARRAYDIGAEEGQNYVCSSGRNHGARDIAATIRQMIGGKA